MQSHHFFSLLVTHPPQQASPENRAGRDASLDLDQSLQSLKRNRQKEVNEPSAMKKRGANSANKSAKRSRRSANRTALDRLRAELKEVEDEQREARKALEEAQKALEEAQKNIKELDKRKADLRAQEKKAAAAVQIEELDHSREANATRECFLTRLPRDLWDVVADKVDENDRAAFSMTCVLFREIQREKVKEERWWPLRTNLDTSCTFTCSWFEFATKLPGSFLKNLKMVKMAAKQNDPITLDHLKVCFIFFSSPPHPLV